MAHISTKIKIYANKEIDFLNEVVLQDDGNGVYIKEWNLSNKTKPTDLQLNSLESQANAYEENLITEQENKKANKQSALTKLSALGLTEAEIKAIIG
jgi:hypothetical protein